MKQNAKENIFIFHIFMSEKTLKLDNIKVNKKNFDAFKQEIDLNLLDINKKVISDKFKHRDKCFK